MSKQTNTRSFSAGLSKKQAAKKQEMIDREDFETKWAMEDLTNPEKAGLSVSHASLICDKLREAYIKKEILGQVDEDDDIEQADEKDNEEDNVEDENEFSEQDSEQEDEPLEKKPSFKDVEKKSPASELGMEDLEKEISAPSNDIGFPSEEENLLNKTLSPEEKEKEEEEEEEEILYPREKNIEPFEEEEEEEEEILYPREKNIEPFEEEEEETEVSLEPGQEEVVIELPGGQQLSLKLIDNLASPSKEENIMAAPTSVQDRKAQRRELIASIIREAAEQMEAEQIKPGSQPGAHKNLGNDTSSQGKPYIMEDATRGVANPGLKSEKMTLENSEGNSLLTNPNFADNAVPTVNPELLANNPDAFFVNQFSDAQSGLFTRKIEETEDKIPTMGNKDIIWGPKNMQMGFEVPTQLDSTQQRRTNVLAGKNEECTMCFNEDNSPLSKVRCNECGSEYILCKECIDDIEKDKEQCPFCVSDNAEDIEDNIDLDLYSKSKSDEKEICEDNRGDGDLNNDGGFRVKRTKNNVGSDKNEDLEVNASLKIKQLEKENQELQLTLAKFAKAVETATLMAYGESIDVTEIPAKVSQFMADKSTNAAGLEHVRQTVASLVKKHHQTRISEFEKGMKKGASAPRINPVGFGYNPNPLQDNRSSEAISDIREALKNVFTYPRKAEDE